jgi:hypothetical protein
MEKSDNGSLNYTANPHQQSSKQANKQPYHREDDHLLNLLAAGGGSTKSNI